MQQLSFVDPDYGNYGADDNHVQIRNSSAGAAPASVPFVSLSNSFASLQLDDEEPEPEQTNNSKKQNHTMPNNRHNSNAKQNSNSANSTNTAQNKPQIKNEYVTQVRYLIVQTTCGLAEALCLSTKEHISKRDWQQVALLYEEAYTMLNNTVSIVHSNCGNLIRRLFNLFCTLFAFSI